MSGQKKESAPRVRLELTTYRLTAGRAADCAIQEQDVSNADTHGTLFCFPLGSQ
jgi:hypothetical protein